jgi:tetratricopeptide (TPR) repeat protein
MTGDDEVMGGWTIDPAARAVLRVERIHKALDEGDFGLAVVEAEELLDEEPEHPEGTFLLAEALLELGDMASAADTYELHLRTAGKDAKNPRSAASWTGLAVARFEGCDVPGAVEAGRQAVALASDLADAHHILGLALERVPGKKNESIGELLAAHRLDPEACPLPLQLERKQWEQVVKQAMTRLPAKLQEFWRSVPLAYEELPPLDLLRTHEPAMSPLVIGLYEGDPPEDPTATPESRPSRLRLFTNNMARVGRRDAAIDEVSAMLESEALDWLALLPEDLEA